jgi:hypothetical protein
MENKKWYHSNPHLNTEIKALVKLQIHGLKCRCGRSHVFYKSTDMVGAFLYFFFFRFPSFAPSLAFIPSFFLPSFSFFISPPFSFPFPPFYVFYPIIPFSSSFPLPPLLVTILFLLTVFFSAFLNIPLFTI